MLGPEPQFVEVPNGTAVVVPLHEPDLYAVMSWTNDRAAGHPVPDRAMS